MFSFLTTILSLLKSVLPFVKEALSVDDQLRGSDRKLKLSVLFSVLFLFIIAIVGYYIVDYQKVTSGVSVSKLRGELELAQRKTKMLEDDLSRERSENNTLMLQAERTRTETQRLRRKIDELRNDLEDAQELVDDLEDNLSCPPQESSSSTYERLLDLNGG